VDVAIWLIVSFSPLPLSKTNEDKGATCSWRVLLLSLRWSAID